MKYLLSIAILLLCVQAFSQDSIKVYGVRDDGAVGQIYVLKPTLYQHPLIALDDYTASLDSGRYYISSLAPNATKDSIILTMLDGTRFAVKDSTGSGGGGGVTSGTYAAMTALTPTDGQQYSITDYLPGPYQYSSWDSSWNYLVAPDFTALSTVSPYMTATATGTGSSVANTTGYNGSGTRYGNYRYFQTGTTVSGSAIDAFTPAALYNNDTNSLRAAIKIKLEINQLSTSTDRFIVTIGRSVTSYASFASINGLYFQYSDSINSGNFQCIASNAGTQTVVNTSVAPNTAAFQEFVITISSWGNKIAGARSTSNRSSVANFYINKVLVGTITTNIPYGFGSASTVVWDGFGILKTTGTTNKTIFFSNLQHWIYPRY